MRAAAFAVLSAFTLSLGCGYVGPIMPPSPEIPTPVIDLVAVESGNKIEISFHTPARTTDNLAIKQFSEIDLRIGPEMVPFDFDSWAESAQSYPLNLPPAGDAFDPKPIPMATSIPLQGLLGKRVAVAVRTAIKRGDHYSAWSNRVVLDVRAPLTPPSKIDARASEQGVVLEWQSVEHATGYRILRKADGEKSMLEIGTSTEPHFVDTTAQFDVNYAYQVIATNGSAQSLPLEVDNVKPVDTFPPSVPSGVTALAGPNSIEVSWQRSPETDVAGYFVYRSVNAGPFERQGEMVTLPAFSDTKVESGKTYRYEISSIDKKNNESAKSAVAEVVF